MIFQLSAFHKINFLRMEVDPKKNDQVKKSTSFCCSSLYGVVR